MDKFITEALPLLEAPPAVRSVHLYKLLCGVNFDRSSSSNALPLRVCLGQETGKNVMDPLRGVPWLTHLLSVVFGQHRLHKLGK